MQTYQPIQLTSFYFNEEDEPAIVLKAFALIRKSISAAFPDVTLIWWLRGKLLQGQVVPMFQIFSSDHLDRKRLQNIIDRCDIDLVLRFKQFNRSQAKIDKWCSTINSQKLHNLSQVYGKERIRRFAITNKPTYTQ